MTTTKRVTAATVNAALKKAGIAERLRQGRGYCYFTDGDAAGWWTSSVPVCYVSDFSVSRWLAELELLRNSPRNFGRSGF
jgi:hypothetical protein